jgi:tetratricopeptide (TPR) repeat protein
MAGDCETALDEMSKAISLDTEEPDFYFTRGRILFGLERFKDAVIDFTKVIATGLADKNGYYLEAAYLHRADAYIRLGDFKQAKADCLYIKDKTRLWTDCLRTKADLLNECE